MPGNLLLEARDNAGNIALEGTGCWEFRIPGPNEGAGEPEGRRPARIFLALAAWAMKRCDGGRLLDRLARGVQVGGEEAVAAERSPDRKCQCERIRAWGTVPHLGHQQRGRTVAAQWRRPSASHENETPCRRAGGRACGGSARLSGGLSLRLVAGGQGAGSWSLDVTRNQPLDRQAAGISPSPIP